MDVGELIEKTGCSEVYEELEMCLGEHDRDWRQCQENVRACWNTALAVGRLMFCFSMF